MDNIRHIHEVLEILFSNEKQFTVHSLHSELAERFGEDVCFVNCADNIFGLQSVIPFLLSRNKIRLEGDEIIPLIPACSH